MVGSHPAGVGSGKAAHTVGLREEVGVGTASPIYKTRKKNRCTLMKLNGL